LVVALALNFVVLLAVVAYLLFFYKWETKTYDDMAQNIGGGYDKADLFDIEAGSNIESLLAKEEGPLQYNAASKKVADNLSLNLTMIPSRFERANSVYSHGKQSILTYDRAQSLLGLGGLGSARYLASQ